MYKEVAGLESQLETERRTVTDTDIENLAEDEANLKNDRKEAWKEKETFQERGKSL